MPELVDRSSDYLVEVRCTSLLTIPTPFGVGETTVSEIHWVPPTTRRSIMYYVRDLLGISERYFPRNRLGFFSYC